MKRGIIAAPVAVNARDNNEFSLSVGMSNEKLRYYLLYWDDIVIPTNSLMHFGIENEDLLIEQGLIRRPSVWLNQIGGDGGKSLLHAQAIVAEALMGMEPGKWVFMQDGDRLHLSDEHSELRNNLTLDIANIMPVPPGNTPLEDILEFKLQRKDQLGELWYYLDNLCLQVQREPDRALAQSTATHEFGKAIEASMRVTKEKWRGFHLTNFKASVSMDYKNIMTGGAAEYLSHTVPAFDALPQGVAAILGIAVSTLKISGDISRTPRAPKSPEQVKLSYLSEFNGSFVY
ncbi:hypothetical protein B6A42_24970 [Vibrio coralliilyticus]|nr:hypothetical protein B6A42_24970 [Vibrio coralliilyticus]